MNLIGASVKKLTGVPWIADQRDSLVQNADRRFERKTVQAKEKALAEHVARHPEDVGRTVEDFKWIMHVIVKWPREAGDPPLD